MQRSAAQRRLSESLCGPLLNYALWKPSEQNRLPVSIHLLTERPPMTVHHSPTLARLDGINLMSTKSIYDIAKRWTVSNPSPKFLIYLYKEFILHNFIVLFSQIKFCIIGIDWCSMGVLHGNGWQNYGKHLLHSLPSRHKGGAHLVSNFILEILSCAQHCPNNNFVVWCHSMVTLIWPLSGWRS